MFALNRDQAADQAEQVIACTFILCGIPAFVLIDGASHSFISSRIVKRHRLPYVSLDIVLFVAIPMSHSMLAKCLVMRCSLGFEGSKLYTNLMVLSMEDSTVFWE